MCVDVKVCRQTGDQIGTECKEGSAEGRNVLFAKKRESSAIVTIICYLNSLTLGQSKWNILEINAQSATSSKILQNFRNKKDSHWKSGRGLTPRPLLDLYPHFLGQY